FREIMEINLESLQSLHELLSDEDVVLKRKKAMLEAESSAYIRHFVKTVIAHDYIGGGLESVTPISRLGDTWKEIKGDVSEVSKGDRYWRWSKIKEQVENSLSSKKSHLEDQYGIQIQESNDFVSVKIVNEGRFSPYRKLGEKERVPVPDSDDIEGSSNGESGGGEDIGDKKDIGVESSEGKRGGDDTPPSSENSDNPMSQMSSMSPEVDVTEEELIDQLQEHGGRLFKSDIEDLWFSFKDAQEIAKDSDRVKESFAAPEGSSQTQNCFVKAGGA
ncbi:MAG: hypothetical protein ABEJ72_08945, partial [Candidatus Aenigmatarchaeota archaeon]